MVSDHAENMGVVARIDAGDKALLATKAGKRTARSLDYDVSLIAALNADTDELLNNFNGAAMIAIKADTGAGKGLGLLRCFVLVHRDLPFIGARMIDRLKRVAVHGGYHKVLHPAPGMDTFPLPVVRPFL